MVQVEARRTRTWPKASQRATADQPVTLRSMADQLRLSPASVSLVLNDAPGAVAIPNATQERIRALARRLGYRPNTLARSLRRQRSLTIGVMVPEISEGYAAQVMSGVEDFLLQEGYLYVVASHRHRPDLVDEYPRLLLDRAVDGIIAVDTPCTRRLPVPVVAVSGHSRTAGVTNIVLDHDAAGRVAIDHLKGLGHRELAFIKGQVFSSDTTVRWRAITAACRALGLAVDQNRVVQLNGDAPSPDVGCHVVRGLLARRRDFTALLAFNDISAMGAMRALREAGRRVPDDVSVVGFDDIQSAAYQHPSLTTIRQPLRRMGELAAETMVRRLQATSRAYPRQIVVQPELVVRESTGPRAS